MCLCYWQLSSGAEVYIYQLTLVFIFMSTVSNDVSSMDENLIDAVLHAAEDGNLFMINQYVRSNSPTLEMLDVLTGWTLLRVASRGGHLDVVKCFAEAGANLKATDNYGRAPLGLALWCNRLDVMKYLVVEAGVKLEAAALRADLFESQPESMKYILEVEAYQGCVQYLSGQMDWPS